MEKHITLAAIFNIVYRAFALMGAAILFLLALVFRSFIATLVEMGALGYRDIPANLLGLIPLILVPVAIMMSILSVLAIVGSVGLLKRKEWARILMIVMSGFNLLRIPLGTILGVYTIWVLVDAQTISLFKTPTPLVPAVA